MAYLVVLVFGAGFFGICAIVLPFLLRFLLLAWLVRLVENVVRSVLQFFKNLIFCLIFVFGTAMLGAFIAGIGLQIAMNVFTAVEGKAADPTTPALIGFLAFFIIVAIRAQQWKFRRARCRSDNVPAPVDEHSFSMPPQPPYPVGYEDVADAWSKAIELAPEHYGPLLQAQGNCAELVNAVEHHEDIPDIAMIDTATLIRNHLAALVRNSERRVRSARPEEKAAIIKEMVNFLLGFGNRAQTDIANAAKGMERQDAALRSHLASQLFG